MNKRLAHFSKRWNMVTQHRKYAQHHHTAKKRKLKVPGKNTAHSNGYNDKDWWCQVVERSWNSSKTLPLFMGTTTLENNSAVSYKIRHTLTLQYSISIARYLPKIHENAYLQESLHANVHSSCISNRQKLETLPRSINMWYIDTVASPSARKRSNSLIHATL